LRRDLPKQGSLKKEEFQKEIHLTFTLGLEDGLEVQTRNAACGWIWQNYLGQGLKSKAIWGYEHCVILREYE
jgi:hypothetical protein